MSIRRKHKLKISKWVEGVLVHDEREYNSYDECMDIIELLEEGLVKIYNSADEIIFEKTNIISNTYA